MSGLTASSGAALGATILGSGIGATVVRGASAASGAVATATAQGASVLGTTPAATTAHGSGVLGTAAAATQGARALGAQPSGHAAQVLGTSFVRTSQTVFAFTGFAFGVYVLVALCLIVFGFVLRRISAQESAA